MYAHHFWGSPLVLLNQEWSNISNLIIFWTRFFAGSGPNLYNVYWTSSRAEELAEYDKIVLQTLKMVALGAVIKLYYVNT